MLNYHRINSLLEKLATIQDKTVEVSREGMEDILNHLVYQDQEIQRLREEAIPGGHDASYPIWLIPDEEA